MFNQESLTLTILRILRFVGFFSIGAYRIGANSALLLIRPPLDEKVDIETIKPHFELTPTKIISLLLCCYKEQATGSALLYFLSGTPTPTHC